MGTYDGCFWERNFAGIVIIFIAVFFGSISLLDNHHLGLSCFASLNALVPRVLKCCVASCPTVSKPRTATSAATEFAGFRDGTTREAYGTDGRRHSD